MATSTVQGTGASHPIDSQIAIPKLMEAFNHYAQELICAPFQITHYTQDDVQRKWTVYYVSSGEAFQLDIPYEDLHEEVTIAQERQVQDSVHNTYGMNTLTFQDGFTLAATTYFKNNKITESKFLGSWNSPRPRLVISGESINITKGFSRIEAIFRRIFQPEMMAIWEEQNNHTIDTYVSFLEKEMGKKKLEEIQKLYNFSFKTMKEKGEPLEPKHVYLCNIGVNNIEMDDVISFGNRAKKFLTSCTSPAQQLSPILQGDNSPFTLREGRAILKTLGEKATVADLFLALGGIRSEPLTEKAFGTIVSLLETPKDNWEALYTGRKFQSTIGGAYNKEITDRDTFRPWVDEQELLQVFQEMKDPFPGETVEKKKLNHYFYEVLCKIVVKKHLMRSLAPDDWRVGALIPSPYKDNQGKTIYYRVDQGVDSGHGKMWYVFRPACEDYDPTLPVIRVPRDTSPDGYAMRAGPTLTRDLAEHPGFLYSSTTHEEDQAFFREFTLPVWMGHVALATRAIESGQNNEPLIPLLNNVRYAAQKEIANRMSEGTLDLKKGRTALQKLDKAFPTKLDKDSLSHYIQEVLSVTPYEKDDLKRLCDLINGKLPRPMASVGNSLGGFDAQNDLLRQTMGENRIPITNLDLYTHSTLKIDKDDDDRFTDFILVQNDLLSGLGVHLSFRHVTELDDIVSLVTDGTFLGRGLQSTIDVSLNVFKSIPFSKSKQIKDLDVHLRRIEFLEKGADFISPTQFNSIEEYDAHAKAYKFKGKSLEEWRKIVIQLNLAEKSEFIWRSWRFFFDCAHPIQKEHANDKLVVTYNSQGKPQHTFTPIRLIPHLERKD